MSLGKMFNRWRFTQRIFMAAIIVIGIGGIMFMSSYTSSVKAGNKFHQYTAQLFSWTPPAIEGKINMDIWTKTCSLNINSIRQFPLFPLFPSERQYLSVRDSISYKIKHQWSALRFMGYLHPPKTGHYSFHLNSPCLAQLWFSSTSDPKNTSKIACTSQNSVKKVIFNVGNLKPVSEGVLLNNGSQYYFEILLVINDFVPQPGNVVLSWMLPGTAYFTKIRGSYVSAYFNASKIYTTPDHPATGHILPSLRFSEDEDKHVGKHYTLNKVRFEEGKQPNFTLKQEYIRDLLGADLLDTKGLEYNRENVTILPYADTSNNDVIDAFMKCTYDPKYTKGRKIKRYNGVWATFFPEVFPNDESGIARLEMPPSHGLKDHAKGNLILKEQDAMEIVKTFMNQLNGKSRKYVLNSIVNIEKYSPVQIKGEKYLLELVLKYKGQNKPMRFSGFFYRELHQRNLCFLQNVRWDPKVWVHVIVNVKNQAGWVVSFVQEMARILNATRDQHVHFVVADYGNKGIDIAKEMHRHGIKNFTVFKNSGAFYKTSSINMAASKVTNPNSILLLMDLHMRYPLNLFDTIRKHTIQGRTGFSPMLMRLFECGRPRTNHLYSHGFYETNGFGIFAVYKSDWDKFGGMNEREFKHKWGGEDWEMVDRVLMKGYEIEKLRLPGFYHFYHDKVGMWN